LNKIKKYYARLHMLEILSKNNFFYFRKWSSSIQKDKKKIIDESEKSLQKLNTYKIIF
jgi:outer membrane protein OmpA-like peptidoglycan-associated protein